MATPRRSARARPSAGGGTTRPAAGRVSRPAARPASGGRARPAGSGSDGGAANPSAPPPPPPPRRQRSGRKPNRPSVTGRAAVLALVLAVLLVSYAYPLRTWFEQRGERVALEREAAQLEASVERLERELRLWNDPAYVAAVARARLGFVMPGEQGYVVVPDPEIEANVDDTGLPPVGQGEWYERLWMSVQAADEDGP